MFGHESLPSKVFAFGCKPPHQGGDVAAAQIWLAHRYQNTLIEIERGRREEVDAARREMCPSVSAAEAAVETIDARLKDLVKLLNADRAESRSRKAGTPEQREAISSAKRQLKEARAILKAEKRSALESPALIEKLNLIQTNSNDKKKAARAACRVYFGTYLATEAAVQQSSRMGAPPKFRRWNGEGKAGTQIQGGMTFAEATAGDDTRLKVEILNPDHRKPHAIASVRIASNADRTPIFAEVKFRMHRPLPERCRIKWVYLVRRRIGPKDHWSIQFTVSDAAGFSPCDRASSGAIGIDLGWRVVPDGIRVASWVDDEHDACELLIPAKRVSQATKSDHLRATRDLNFNAMREKLCAWMAANNHADWLKEACATIAQWRSCNRLARVVIQWRDSRFDGDDGIFGECEAWRKQDKHLWLWESHQRASFSRWRKEFYRLFAVRLRQKYATCRSENTDWAAMARLPAVETDDPIIKAARRNQRIAAVGLLAEQIRQFGPRVEKVEAKNTTRCCHVCGHSEAFDAIRELVRTCPNCGAVWDQDANAAVNILASAEVM